MNEVSINGTALLEKLEKRRGYIREEQKHGQLAQDTFIGHMDESNHVTKVVQSMINVASKELYKSDVTEDDGK